jgi:phage terminase small subunit
MGVPTLEKAPGGLHEPWLGIWRISLKQMKEQGTWLVSQRPLLDEYVYALRAAQNARASAESAVAWDKHSKRALALADALGLTPKAQKVLAAKLKEGDEHQDDPFSGLDEIAQKRKAKAS